MAVTKKPNYDFAGWVTKNDLLCADGVVIRHGAFNDIDGKTVPLVWEHVHNDPTNVLGHIQLKEADGGVYGYGYLNQTAEAQHAKELLMHGDINAMSIAANQIQRQGNNVTHGRIFEVSLVLAGANPGALIEDVVEHSDSDGETAIIYPGTRLVTPDDLLEHSEGESTVNNDSNKSNTEQDNSDQTIQDVLDTLSPLQMQAVEALVGLVAQSSSEQADNSDNNDTEEQSGRNNGEVLEHSNTEGENTMQHNIFDQHEQEDQAVITHSQLNTLVQSAAKNKVSSLRDYLIQGINAQVGDTMEHSITNIDTLFPDYHQMDATPKIYKDQQTNSDAIVNAIAKSPFSRVKSRYADLTADTARAKGYIKGAQKLEQIFSVANRQVDPQTVYIKQKLDRDDIVDITDFDVVQFVNTEMRMKLIEELARAVMIGDGRQATDPDKIQEAHIIPITTDNDLYTIKKQYTAIDTDFIETVVKAMSEYQGSGTPSLYMNPLTLAKLRLLKASDGHYLFGQIPNATSIAAILGVQNVVTTSFLPDGAALCVNLSDYQFGSTKGGEITSFDDFDIDFNQYKYLIETRLSGALTTLKSAIYFTKAATTGGTTQGK